MKKRDYEKETVWLHLDKDLHLGRDINVCFWKDPSQHYTMELLRVTNTRIEDKSQEEVQQLNKDYFDVASNIFIDCDINGIDFSTPESTEEAFYHKDLPWGIFHETLIAYLARLMTEYQVLKNLLRRANVLSSSGTDKHDEEEE